MIGPKRLRRLIILFMILFVFFAPVIPDTAPQMWLLPWFWQCYGGPISPGHPYPGFQPVQVYASISYIVAQQIIHSTTLTDHGLFGLVVVPNDGLDSVQFPPVGFRTVICG